MEDIHRQGSLTAVPQLPTAVIVCILELLPANERALTGRLVCHDAWKALSGPEHCTASLAQPLPPHAALWGQEAGQQYVRQLSFRNKWQLLCTAAISGSEVNLEVAWALLQPSLFPGLSQEYYLGTLSKAPRPGLAAAQAGHPQLLRWFVDRCPRVLELGPTLAAAAKHCDLAGLQAAWHALPCAHGDSSGSRLPLGLDVLDAAAQSATGDGLAKMQWVLEEGRGAFKLTGDTAEYAARSSNVAGLQWLRDRGCRMTRDVLEAALEDGSWDMVQWLMEKHSWMLPSAGSASQWYHMFRAAANSSHDWQVRVQWLVSKGGRLEHCTSRIQDMALYSGNVALSLLIPWPSASWARAQPVLAAAAAASGSIQLAERARSAGVAFTPRALFAAAGQSDLAMLRWLVHEAGVPVGGLDLGAVIEPWRSETVAGLRDLLQAVQLLVGAGCRRVGPTGLSAAARKGDLRLVQYLHAELGCEVTGEAVGAAALSGCEALMEWLWEHKADGNPPTVFYIDLALDGDLAMLSTLRRLGAPFGPSHDLVRAAKEGVRRPVVEWLAENGAPLGSHDDLQNAFLNNRQRDRDLRAVGRWLQDLVSARQRRGKAQVQRLQQLPPLSAASGGAGPSGLFGPAGVQRAAGDGGEAKQERPEAQGGTVSVGGEPHPDPQAAPEPGEDAATLALQQQQQQQADGDGAGAGVAQAHQQLLTQGPVPMGGEDCAGPSGAVRPSGARGFLETAEEGWPALGKEPVRQGGALPSNGTDGAASASGGGSAAPGAIDDPDWHADTFPNRFLDSIMEHQEEIKAAAAVTIAALQGQVKREREQAERERVRAERERVRAERERERAERERVRAEAAEEGQAVLQQQLVQERERAAAAAAGMAALQEQVRQLQGAGGSAGLPGQGA